MCLGFGDVPNDNKRSVVNFGTVLPVGWGSHGDFLEVGGPDWLFEGRAEFGQWREGGGHCRVGTGTAAKAEGTITSFTEGCRLPWLGSHA